MNKSVLQWVSKLQMYQKGTMSIIKLLKGGNQAQMSLNACFVDPDNYQEVRAKMGCSLDRNHNILGKAAIITAYDKENI